jgi:hypothetical protein
MMDTIRGHRHLGVICNHPSVAIREITEEGRHSIVGGEDTVTSWSYQEIYCLVCGEGLGIPRDPKEEENG